MSDNFVRRVPQGERGRKRVALILEAAEQELVESGYDHMTTNAVAARAGISIGSIYQFYPNKDALVTALAEAYHAEIRGLYDRLFAEMNPRAPLPELIDHLVDPLVAYNAAKPGFESLFCSTLSPLKQMAAVDALRAEIIDRTVQVFAALCPGMDDSRRRSYIVIAVHAVEALLPLVSTAKPEERAFVLSEIKRMLQVYLQPVLSP